MAGRTDVRLIGPIDARPLPAVASGLTTVGVAQVTTTVNGTGTVSAQNGVAKVTWAPPGGVTQKSATVTASASGQTSVTTTVTGALTTAILGLDNAQVDPINMATGLPLPWAFSVDLIDTGDAHHILNLGTKTPTLTKPNANISGVPTGAAGDLRPPAGALTTVTFAQFQALNTADGQTFTGYHITGGGSLFHGSDAAPVVFKNCQIDGVIGLKGGGVFRTAAFYDCKIVLPGTASTGMFTSSHSAQTLVRCEIVGGADQFQQFQTGSRFKHLYMHGQAPSAGSHADFMQLTSGQQDVWWLGCFYDASDADTSLAGINSVFQGGTWSTLSERMQVTWDSCWINGSSTGHYIYSGVVPNGTLAGDVQFRNCKFGLHIDRMWYGSDGTDGVHPGAAYAAGKLIFGDDNVWEVTGTTLGGATAVAGQPFPKPS